MFKKILYVFLIAMVPVIELRGAIPAGAALDLPFYWNYIAAVLGNMLPVPFILLFIPAILDFMKRHHIFPRLVGWIERKGLRGVEKLRAKSGEGTDNDGGETSAAPSGVQPAADPTVDLTTDPATDLITDLTTDPTTDPAAATPAAEMTAGKKKIRVTFGVCLGLFAFVAVPLPGTGAWTGALVASLCGLPKRYAIPTILLGVMTAGVIVSLASYGVVAAFSIFTKN